MSEAIKMLAINFSQGAFILALLTEGSILHCSSCICEVLQGGGGPADRSCSLLLCSQQFDVSSVLSKLDIRQGNEPMRLPRSLRDANVV
jgi:hypothetical protein